MKKYFSSYWIRSAFYTFLQHFSLTLFGLVNFMVLIRSFSKAQMGTWALFLAVTAIFEAMKTGLLKNAHIRFVSHNDHPDERSAIAASSFVINLVITLLFVGLVLFAAGPFSRLLNAGDDLASMLRWFIPGLLFMVFFSHFEAIQQSHLDFKGVFAGYFIRQFSFFGVVVVHALWKIPYTLEHLALYQSGGILLGTVVLFLYSRKYLQFRFNVRTSWIRRIMGYGGYIFGSGLMANIFASLDQLMTAAFLSSSSVAYYNAASRINGLVDIPSHAAASILFPKMARASTEEGPAKVKYLYERMVAMLLSLTTPAALFMLVFPQFVIRVIAGPEYEGAAVILQLYMVTGLLRPLQNQAANVLNSMGKPGLCFLINTISLLANLGINYFCLKAFGFYGAAIGTLTTYLLGALAWYLVMRRQIGIDLGTILRYMGETYKMLFSQASSLIARIRPAFLY